MAKTSRPREDRLRAIATFAFRAVLVLVVGVTTLVIIAAGERAARAAERK
jgi:hypothetical protein